MGEPKFSRPKYDTPSHPWKADRIEEEHAIRASHGLKNMKEIWKAKSQLRRHRRQAMRLIGNVDTTEGHGKREMEDLLHSLHQKGLVTQRPASTTSFPWALRRSSTAASKPKSTTRAWPAPSSRHANSSPTDKSSSVSRR